MSSLAFYRKYRPKRFADMLGHDAITTVLKNAAAGRRISHAYLFAGVRGTGKTTAARILAKAANCLTLSQHPDLARHGEPCNECASCVAIDKSETIDVVEIDAASNRGIDEVRALKEGAQFAPTYLNRKVFIIDEAHALTKDASHALLKLLEEPPTHAMFILATTEPEKLLPTIISRTQRFDFKSLPVSLIQKKLRAVAGQEDISITDGALQFIAQSAEGSLRDAETILDQAASYGHSHIDIKILEAMLGRAGTRIIENLIALFLTNDSGRIISQLNELEQNGYNASAVNKDLIRYVRGVLATTLASPNERAENEEPSYRNTDPKQLIRLLTALLEAQEYIRISPLPFLPIELAMVEAIDQGNTTQPRLPP